jgi:hypothetical protein
MPTMGSYRVTAAVCIGTVAGSLVLLLLLMMMMMMLLCKVASAAARVRHMCCLGLFSIKAYLSVLLLLLPPLVCQCCC